MKKIKILFYLKLHSSLGHIKRVINLAKKAETEISSEVKIICLYKDNIEVPFDIPITTYFINTSSLCENNYDEVLKDFSPDVLISEFIPIGSSHLVNNLNSLISKIKLVNPNFNMILSLRDIIGLKEDCIKDNSLKFIRENVHHILVHGDKRITDVHQYLSKDLHEKIYWTGYVAEEHNFQSREKLLKKYKISPKDKVIVISVGGGRDGNHRINGIIKALEKIQNIHVFLFYGALSNSKVCDYSSNTIENINISEHSNEIMDYIMASDLNICMGGYNSMVNILTTKKPSLILPRTEDPEQLTRAINFKKLGVIDYLLDENDTESLRKSILFLLEENKVAPETGISLEGAKNTSLFIKKLLESS